MLQIHFMLGIHVAQADRIFLPQERHTLTPVSKVLIFFFFFVNFSLHIFNIINLILKKSLQKKKRKKNTSKLTKPQNNTTQMNTSMQLKLTFGNEIVKLHIKFNTCRICFLHLVKTNQTRKP